MDEIVKREDALFGHISRLIDEAHKHVKTTVNTTMVYTYYGVGKYIVEDEQQGYERAAYGKKVLKALSEKLCLKYGEGWSYSNLRQIRQFFLAYANLTDSVCQIQFDLSWSHYLILMRIENLLCKEKNDALVELTLPEDANIYASAYQLYLPNKALLQAKVKEWIEEFEENEELKKLENNE